MVHKGEIRPWRLHWYNRRSSVIAFLKALFPFAFRKSKKPAEQVLEIASGQRNRLALGLLLLTIALCLAVVLAMSFWR